MHNTIQATPDSVLPLSQVLIIGLLSQLYPQELTMWTARRPEQAPDYPMSKCWLCVIYVNTGRGMNGMSHGGPGVKISVV